jgi:hypothetical protein
MPTQGRRRPTHRLSVAVGVSILFAMLTAVGDGLGEEHHANSQSRQTAPRVTQTYRSEPAGPTPASTALRGSWQYNSSVPNGPCASSNTIRPASMPRA